MRTDSPYHGPQFESLEPRLLLDGAPTLTVPDMNVYEDAGSMQFAVYLDSTHAQPVTINYATANDSALAGADYVAASGSLVFAPGETVKYVDVDLIVDQIYEAPENFRITFSSPAGPIYGDSHANGNILEMDPPTLSIMDGDEFEDSGSMRFDVQLAAPRTRPVTINYVTADGSAVAGSDYVAASGSLVFAPGETTKYVDVDLIDDNIHENHEEFRLDFSNPAGPLYGDTTARGMIQDDDLAPVEFSITGDATVAEGNVANYTISYTGGTLASGETMTIQVNTGPGTTVTPDATAGVDYNPVNNTLTFSGGGPTAMGINVTTMSDSLVEGDEEFSVSLANPSRGTIGNDQVNTIIMDTTPPPVEFSITGDATVAEGNVANYTISYTGGTLASGETMTIQVNTGPGTTVTPDATAGVDYNPVNNTLTFSGGGPTAMGINVTTMSDSLVEGDEEFSVSLANPSRGTIGDDQVNTIILDANDPPVITDLTVTPNPVDESGSATLSGTFTDFDQADVHTVTIDWGDGSTPTVLDLPVGDRTFQATHPYLDDNPTATPADDYTITVTVDDGFSPPAGGAPMGPTLVGDFNGDGIVNATDLAIMKTYFGQSGATAAQGDLSGDGIVSTIDLAIMRNVYGQTAAPAPLSAQPGQDTETTTVTVNNVDPEIVNLLADPDPIYKNNSTTVSGTFTDPGTLDEHDVAIDWGDGTAPTVLDLTVGDRAFDAAHTYASTGTGQQDVYTVTVTVTDDDTGDDVETTTVTVINGVLIDGFSAGDTTVDLDDGEILEHTIQTGLPITDTHGGTRYVQADWQGIPLNVGGPDTGDFGNVAIAGGEANITLEGDPRFSFGYGQAAGAAYAWAQEDWSTSDVLTVTLAQPVAESMVFGVYLWGQLDGRTQLWCSTPIQLTAGQTTVTYNLPNATTFTAYAADGSTRTATVDELMQHVTGLTVQWRGGYNNNAVTAFAIDTIEMLAV